MNKEIFRRALRMAAGPDAFGELAEALGFAAEAHPVDFVGDPAPSFTAGSRRFSAGFGA